MAKVLLMGDKVTRFEHLGVKAPEGWEFIEIGPEHSEEEIITLGQGCDAIIVNPLPQFKVTDNILAGIPTVKLVQSEGVGYNVIDVEVAKERGIYVANNQGINTSAVAEHVIGLMLAALRHTVQSDKEIRKGNYKTYQKTLHVNEIIELSECALGIIGMGAIGKDTAKKLISFDCKVYYYDPFRLTPELEEELQVEYKSLEEIYPICDIISLSVPVTPQTNKLMNREVFKKMRNHCILINTARGAIIDEADLIDALINNEIGMACLDTFEEEPLPFANDLLHLPDQIANKLILTPHIAGTTHLTFKKSLTWSFENVSRVMNGEKPIHIVNGL